MAVKYPTARRPKHEADFREVVGMIQAAKVRAYHAVNTVLLDLYWNVGAFISRKVQQQGWGKGTVASLSDYVRAHQPQTKGFSAPNLWRMKQFFEFYHDRSKLSAALRELSWTQNLMIMSKCKRPEEREFYIQMTLREKWPSRELDRQIDACLFERQVLRPAKLAPPLRELYPSAAQVFKDSYFLDFLNLPEPFDEHDLQKGLVANLKQFLLELGRDFCFSGGRVPDPTATPETTPNAMTKRLPEGWAETTLGDIRIAQQAGEKIGLTFVGRGLAVRVAPPLGHTLAEAVPAQP